MQTLRLESSVNALLSRHSTDHDLEILLPDHKSVKLLGALKLEFQKIYDLARNKLEDEATVRECELVSTTKGHIASAKWNAMSLEERHSFCPLRMLASCRNGAALVRVHIDSCKYLWLFDKYSTLGDLRSYVSAHTWCTADFALEYEVQRVKKHRKDPTRKKTVTQKVALRGDARKLLFSLIDRKAPAGVVVVRLGADDDVGSPGGTTAVPQLPLKVSIDADRFFVLDGAERQALSYASVLSMAKQQRQLVGSDVQHTCSLFLPTGEPCQLDDAVPGDLTELDWYIVGVNCFAIVVTSCLHETAVALVKPSTSVLNLKRQLAVLLSHMPVENQLLSFKGHALDVDVATMAYSGVTPDAMLTVDFQVKPRLTMEQEARLWQGGRKTDPHEVKVTILLARNLPPASLLGSDTYCRMIYKDQTFKTEVSKTSQPVWNQSFSICLLGTVTKTSLVTVEIWRYSSMLGCCAVSLMGLTKKKPFRVRYELCLGEQGTVELVLEATDFDTSLLRDPSYQTRAKLLLDEVEQRAMQSPRTVLSRKMAVTSKGQYDLNEGGPEPNRDSSSLALASVSLPGLENEPTQANAGTRKRAPSLTLGLARTSGKLPQFSFSPNLGDDPSEMHHVQRVEL